MPGQSDRGAFLCDAGHELRVTQRCIRNEFALDPPQEFEFLERSQEIVVALRSKRDVTTTGGKTVGPARGERTLYHLGRGDDHRGATWFDGTSGVVWLCAYRLHRSGTPNDAFPYFRGLIESGAIWPIEEDYVWLERDRAARLASRLPEAAQELLADARANRNLERRATIGTEEVGVLVEVVETLEETYVALSVAKVPPTYLIILLAAFYPDRPFADWELKQRLPTRRLRDAEICVSILHD